MITRQKSRSIYKERWGSVESHDLDALDLEIMKCIVRKPGINVVSIWRCVEPYKGNSIKELSVRYRVKTLEKAEYIRTEKVRNERRCYPSGVEYADDRKTWSEP